MSFSESVVPTTISPSSRSAFVRCQSWRRNRQTQASRTPTTGPTGGTSRRAGRSRAAPRVRPNCSIASRSRAVILLAAPDDRLVLAVVDDDRRDRRPRPRSRACSVSVRAERRVGDDERRDELGGERPLAVVEAAGHLAGSGRRLVGSTSVSRSSARSVASRTRAASSRTAVQRSDVSAWSVVRAASGQARDRRRRGGLAAPPSSSRARTPRRPAATWRLERATAGVGDPDRLLGRVVVDRLDGLAAASSRARSVWISLV